MKVDVAKLNPLEKAAFEAAQERGQEWPPRNTPRTYAPPAENELHRDRAAGRKSRTKPYVEELLDQRDREEEAARKARPRRHAAIDRLYDELSDDPAGRIALLRNVDAGVVKGEILAGLRTRTDKLNYAVSGVLPAGFSTNSASGGRDWPLPLGGGWRPVAR